MCATFHVILTSLCVKETTVRFELVAFSGSDCPPKRSNFQRGTCPGRRMFDTESFVSPVCVCVCGPIDERTVDAVRRRVIRFDDVRLILQRRRKAAFTLSHRLSLRTDEDERL